MIFGSLCSGIEAASVAWAPLGWRAAFVSEIEPFPCHALAHRHGASRPEHMPDPAQALTAKDRRHRIAAIKAVARLPERGRIPNHGDMTTFKEWPHHAIDVLVGGTPCQSFSLAGLRKGLDDPRGNLMLTYLAIADRYRPRWLVWENVPGVLSDEGNAFGALLGGLAELGYGFAYRVLDAQYVRVGGFWRAVPQRRRRVFVVGYLGDWRRAAAVLFDFESLCGNSPPRRLAGERAAPTLSARTQGGGGLGTDFDCDGGLVADEVARAVKAAHKGHRDDPSTDNFIAFGGNNTSGPIDVATAQTAHGGSGRFDFESETFVAHALRADGFDASEDGTGRGTPLVPVVPVCFSAKDYGADAMDDCSPTLRAGGHSESHANAGVMPAIAFRTTGNDGCYETGDVTACLNTASDPNQITLMQAWRVRRPMPIECERLQGFPDGYTDVPYRGRNSTPDGPRYKALGNSMAVNVMRWIGTRIESVDQIDVEAA